MNWRELVLYTTGTEPPIDYLPATVASILLFAIILSFSFIMHRLSEIFLPQGHQIYFLDFFKTMAFCTYPFGLMIMRNYHGDLGYVMSSITLNTVTFFTLKTGEGSPIGNWLIFVKGGQSKTNCLIRIFVQVCAGISAFRFGKFLMILDLHPAFGENLRQTECIAALNVSALLGMVIELLGTVWDVWFHSQKFSDNVVLDKLVKFCNSSLTFCLGGYPTGMIREPAKATGLTFGCKGISGPEHILVYWIGPLAGSFIGYKIVSIQNQFSIKHSTQNSNESTKDNKKGNEVKTKKMRGGRKLKHY